MKTMISLLVVLALPILSGAEEPDRRKFSEEAEKTAQSRQVKIREGIGREFSEEAEKEKTAQSLRVKIQEEIKTLGNHPWAGEYYEGDGLGVNVYLSLAPKAGYVYEWHGCMGLYDRNYGAVEEKDGKLRFSFTFERDREGLVGIAEELISIDWGERKYLVPAKEIVGFCNEVNDGSEPRTDVHGMSLLRRGDEEKKVTGLPAIPKAFEPYLLSKPIETEIVSVGRPTTTSNEGDVKEVTIRVTLKHGTKAGLLPGMKLRVIKPDSVYDSFILDKVEEQQSEGVIKRYPLEGALGLLSLLDKTPKIGWKLSTRHAWRTANKSNDQEGAVKQGE